ncbi:flavin monoamine oxidase family protein [Homoserinimonas sp. A447]
MRIKRRTFLIGSVSGLSLLAVSACTPDAPEPTPTVPNVPALVPRPIAVERTNWTADPFSYGAFSYAAVGSGPQDRVAMRQPVDGRIFFAGEATSDANPGTVYGARVSGLRAAVEIGQVASPGERVTVIGAGIAGATAARRLKDDGFDVVVVEGKERAGGRIHSLSGDEWPFPVELGAALVQGPGSTIESELERLGIDTVAAPADPEQRTATGSVLEPAPVGETALAEAIDWAASQPSDTSLADALRESGATDLDSQGGESGVSEAERLEHYLQTEIAIRRAADPDDLSAWFAEPPVEDGEEGDGLLVVGGFQRLVVDALEDLDILPSSTVVAVQNTDRGVSLRLARGESLSADRVIVTVPLGVLKAGTIQFDPPLPFSHRGAIDSLGMGRQDKLVLRFEEPFWSTSATRWDIVGTDTDFPLWLNLEPLTGEPVLVALFGGDSADRLSAATDAELLEAALASLEPFMDPELVTDEDTDS